MFIILLGETVLVIAGGTYGNELLRSVEVFGNENCKVQPLPNDAAVTSFFVLHGKHILVCGVGGWYCFKLVT